MNKAKTSFKDKYQKIKKMGEGTYGTVYKAKNNITSQIVAIKKIKFI
jgi:serine/threonine protein kinase